jgi:NAD(P)-dependent dehydrogenase (short-subunit alcohol dehydrogenase family)
MVRQTREKVAIVTGSCRSVGQAIALEFAKEGYCIAVNGIDKTALENVSRNIARAVSGKEEDYDIYSFVCR